MGIKHSTPAPTEEDFCVQHSPPPLTLSKNIKPLEIAIDLEIKQHSWARRCPEMPINFPLLDDEGKEVKLKLVNIQESQTNGIPRCVLMVDEEPVAVMYLEHPFTATARAVICSFVPHSREYSSCGEHQGRSLYEWASVDTKRESHQFLVKSIVEQGLCYTTDYYGFVAGVNKFVLKREDQVCASLKLVKNKKFWNCKIGPGMDPMFIICFVICCDKLRESQDRRIEILSATSRGDFKTDKLLRGPSHPVTA